MKVLIVDDERPARERLKRLATELNGVEVVGEAANGREAIAAHAEHRPEVVLLDIRMPGMDGLEAARHLAGLERPPAVIFITAFGEHALEAFEAQAVDYLLKPVRRERLEQALAHASRLTRAQLSSLALNANHSARSHLSAVQHGNLALLAVQDVLFFQAEHKYVTAHHREGELLIEDSLKTLEEEFGEQFLRVHRNALVARRAIKALERDANGTCRLHLDGTEMRVEISRRHLAAVRRALRSGG